MSRAGRITFTYAALSATWILFSDTIANLLFSDRPELLLWANTTKGWFFVAVTSLLLWAVLSRHEAWLLRQMLALEESEARYRSVIESISDVYYRTDQGGKLIMVSPSGAKVLGYGSVEEILGRDISVFWKNPLQREAFLDRIRADGAVHDYEVELARKDGSTLTVSTSSASYLGPGGKVLGVEGIFRDISARKLAEQALKESEERLRTIFDTSPSAIFLMDTAGRVVEANDRMSELFGYPPRELQGKPYTELIHSEQSALAVARLKALMDGEVECLDLERGYLRADGSEFWGHLTGRRLRGQDGTFPGMVGLIADITANKAVEAKLESSHELLKSILDSLPLAVIGVDGGNRITQFNKFAQEISGQSFEKAVGMKFPDALAGLPVSRDDLEKVRSGRETLRVDKAPLPSASGTLLADILMYPLDAGDKDQAVIIVEDVTERVRLQEMMVQTEKMMSVGGLAAGMAHEINNPLGGIVQSTQVILQRLECDSRANQLAAEQAGCPLAALRDYLDRRDIITMTRAVRTSAIRAAHIVASMLEFSRKEDFARAPVDVNALLNKAVELCSTDYDLKKKYDFRKIEIETDYDPKLPPAPCAGTQIEQVFMNLLRNAAQAMRERPGGGPPPKIVLRTRVEGDFIRIDVSDNGPGMPEEVRHRIFEPFFSTKLPGDGTGLGLSVSYFIVVSNHKGDIQVQSAPGRGSTFTVRLPWREAA